MGAVDDPHVVAGVVSLCVREAGPPLLDMDRLTSVADAAASAGEDPTGLRSLRLIMAGAGGSAGALLRLLNAVAGASPAPEATTQFLAAALGPAIARPAGSAFMSLRHQARLPAVRAVAEKLIERAWEVAPAPPPASAVRVWPRGLRWSHLISVWLELPPRGRLLATPLRCLAGGGGGGGGV